MNPINEISKISDQIPLEALQDIHRRIADWLAGGGEADEPYIHQQLQIDHALDCGDVERFMLLTEELKGMGVLV